MNISVKEVTDKDQWEKCVLHFRPHSFLHSWAWGEFQKKMGNNFWRIGIYNQDRLDGVALIVKSVARRGTFISCPHGPLIDWHNQEHFKALLECLRSLAMKEEASFLRISTVLKNNEENLAIFEKANFRRAPMHLQSEINWILDIAPSEDELLANMRKTTRYSIKKAQKDGVHIKISQELSQVAKFDEVYQATVARQHFVPYPRDYLDEEFKLFNEKSEVLLFFAEYNNEVLATAMIIFHNNEAFYHHGASTLKFPKIPAAYLLQWEAICEAKARGCNFYNFWGIAPEGDLDHPWAGLTLFKQGFGGFADEYLPAQDFIYSSKYWFTYSIERARRWKRGF